MLAALLILPNVVAGTLSKVWIQFPGLDKPTHFFAFTAVFLMAYGVMRGRAWPRQEREKLCVAVCLSLLISVADEVQQALLGMGRTAEYGDLVADAAGVLVGLTVVSARRLGMGRTIAIVVLLLLPVAAVTLQTYHDLKHFNRGMVYEREHDYQRARAEYMLAVESGFQSAELYNAIAWLDIEFLNADPFEAEGYAARAFAMDPDNPDIVDTYGWIVVQAGRPREGLAFLERAKSMKSSMYCIDLHLGVAYMKTGDRDRAADYLKRQIERNAADRWGRSAKLALDQLEGNAG
ncbi:MAG: VanZ family protein [Nitrospira sp.]